MSGKLGQIQLLIFLTHEHSVHCSIRIVCVSVGDRDFSVLLLIQRSILSVTRF